MAKRTSDGVRDDAGPDKGLSIALLDYLTQPFFVIDARTSVILMANSACTVFGNINKDTTCYELMHGSSEPCGSGERWPWN